MSRSRLDCHSHGCDYSSFQHIKVSDPCRSVNSLLTPNLCFDSTSPSVVKKHHSLLRGCKAQFLSIRQAYLKFNHKGKVSDCQNQISSYFSIMQYTSIIICTESSLINSLSASVLVSENGVSLYIYFIFFVPYMIYVFIIKIYCSCLTKQKNLKCCGICIFCRNLNQL